MNKRIIDRKSKIESAHTEAKNNAPHDRQDLRRRLLQLILKTEAERRARDLAERRPEDFRAVCSLSADARRAAGAAANLAVFDPEALVEKEFATGPTPKKRA